MITLITGENTFENERTLASIIANSSAVAEKIDGAELGLRQLPDLLMGATLFADERLVVIKNLSENKTIWNDFEQWAKRVNSDVHVVLVESKPDKRTKTYKDLQKNVSVHESKLWTERDTARAEQWVADEAKQIGFELDKKSAHLLVNQVGVNQWLLYQALEKLALSDEVTPQKIEEIIEPNPSENVFYLFDAALRGKAESVKQMLKTLELTEEPYRLFGLLSTQALQLIALVVADKPSAEVASELGVHPFALSKLTTYAKTYKPGQAKELLVIFTEADHEMKTSATDPWLLIERALIKVCLMHKK